MYSRYPIFNKKYKTYEKARKSTFPRNRAIIRRVALRYDSGVGMIISNRELKRAFNMLKALVETVNNVQDCVSSCFSRDMETVRKKQMEMLEVRSVEQR